MEDTKQDEINRLKLLILQNAIDDDTAREAVNIIDELFTKV